MSEHDAGDDSERSGGTSSLRAQRLTNRVYGSSDSSKKGARRAFPGEAAFRRLVEEARYELEVDPYRGLLRYGSGGASSSDTVNPPLHPLQQLSPWEVTCRWGVPLPVSSGNAEGDAGSPAQQQKQQQQQSPESTLVQMVCQNECPCLTRWTETQQASRKKTQRKGKANEAPALGGRPASAERCRCDYNPFCLATLGGAMDQVLQRRLEVLVGEKSQETDVSSVAPTKYGEDYNDEVLVEEDDGDCNEMAVTETAIPKKAKPSALTISSPSATSSSSYMVDLQDSGDESTPILQPKGGLSTDQRKPLEETIYTQRTWARLRKLRQSTCVERDRIRDYLATTLQDLTVTLSVETCVERIAQWHNKLIFQNPCFMEADRPDMIRLAIPPGIENLGATCYLNTQLQCLAQVTVFLDGILSWRAPLLQTEDDRMTKVLALFQQICTNLYAGTQSTITTLEFSNELGLDFHEQQDPNEFSKLFFDHVHTAFQKEASDKPGGLSELLPHLFQGILQHQTICQTCGSKSQRSEEFMDLHLPIVKRSDDCHIRRKGQQSIMDSLGSMFSNKDTDVQYLLNRYLQDEMLEGDNQYYCDNCGGKQDACRRVVFQKLPPLLNLPLNRYVYDMKSASKKKLLEKVLLPLDLRIELTEKDSGSNSEHRYVLCAAMLHRGKSAHSGHYVAEAMDWCTGRWFEFNDSAVKILDDGPSSSFDQNAKSTLYGLKKNTEGSQDAYNLFYVEETFLAQSIFDRMQGLARKEAFSSVTDEKNIVRTQLYTDLRESCTNDREGSDRLECRRQDILQECFPSSRPLEGLTDHSDPPPVWVPGDFLRRYFSCTDRFDGELEHHVMENVIKVSDSLCIHGQKGVCPTVACRGKLLPRFVYETIVELLMAERVRLLKQEGAREEPQDVFVVTPSDSLFCQECVDDYRRDLRPKVHLFEDYAFLFDELDPKSDDLSLEYEPGTVFEREVDGFVYLVARKSCTAIRNHVKHVMKLISAADSEAFCVDEKLLPEHESVAEGLGALKLEDLSFDMTPENGDCKLDPYLNTSITCSHGRCTRITKTIVRFVPFEVWSKLKKHFPEAIERRLPRRSSDQDGLLDDGGMCQLCEAEDTMSDNLSSQLIRVAKFAAHAADSSESDAENLLGSNNDTSPRLVHTKDWQAFKEFASAFRRKRPKSEPGELRRDVLRHLLPDTYVPQLISEPERNQEESIGPLSSTRALMRRFVRPLVCTKHQLPVTEGVLVSSDIEDSRLSASVRIVPEAVYREYVTILCAVARILILSEELRDIDVFSDYDENPLRASEAFCSEFGVFDWHPKILHCGATKYTPDSFVMGNELLSIRCKSSSSLCSSVDCLDALQKLSPTKHNGDTNDPLACGFAANNPIPIDVDGDETTGDWNTFPLPVFEAEPFATEDDILESLSQCSGLSMLETDSSLRRSTRRRKTRVPVGVLMNEESVRADLGRNIAAFRLSLLQECQDFSLNQKLLLVVSPVDTRADADFTVAKPSKTVVLDFGMNQKTLMSICEEALGGNLAALVPKESLVVVRQDIVEESATDYPKESLMDDLIYMSGVASSDSNGKKRRRGPLEKGFTGTFLSAGLPVDKKVRSGEDEGPICLDESEPSEPTALVSVDMNTKTPAKETLSLLKAPLVKSPSDKADKLERFSVEVKDGDVDGDGGSSILDQVGLENVNLAQQVISEISRHETVDPDCPQDERWTKDAVVWVIREKPQLLPFIDKLVKAALQKFIEYSQSTKVSKHDEISPARATRGQWDVAMEERGVRAQETSMNVNDIRDEDVGLLSDVMDLLRMNKEVDNSHKKKIEEAAMWTLTVNKNPLTRRNAQELASEAFAKYLELTD